MINQSQFHIVKTSEIRTSRNGKTRMQFAEGTKVPLHIAYEYGLVDEPAVMPLARPESEKPDVAANDEPVRSQGE